MLRQYTYRRIFGVCFLLITIACRANAQNADSLYTAARNMAFNEKDYTAAIAFSQQALRTNPAYTDVTLFIARLYTWDKKPDSARRYFEQVLKQQPDLEDAYIGYTDLEYWNDNNDTALSIIEKGLSYHPSSIPLKLRKAKIYYSKREFNTAILLADTILQADRNNTDARTLAAQIRDNISKNRVGVKYDYISFDKQFPDPWQLISIDYTRQTRAGAFTARVNYANRFAKDGLQYELESYPIFSKTFYGYLNLAYSDNVGVFPRWKAGASLYANLPKAFESEIGIRYLYFNNDVFAYTLYVGKYYKSFLFGARTFLTPNSINIAQSYSVNARYYYGGIDDYVGLMVGAGLSPDDRRVNVQLNSVYKLRTYLGELTVRRAIRKLNIITINASLLNQEYRPATVGNQLQLGIGYIRRF